MIGVLDAGVIVRSSDMLVRSCWSSPGVGLA
jgi:hypothetical protein